MQHAPNASKSSADAAPRVPHVLDLLRVDIDGQVVIGFCDDREVVRYSVSTSAKGLGCDKDSQKTPWGAHRIRVKIGHGCPEGAVLLGRRWTGETLDQNLLERFPGRDWVLSRALWLQGLELGTNRGGDWDTLRRFIYFHGTHEEARIGQPISFGCVRMRNRDIIELFDLVPTGCRVFIG
jgi:lipoprotein-anchoring transpeptidase ErfK/SrfK